MVVRPFPIAYVFLVAIVKRPDAIQAKVFPNLACSRDFLSGNVLTQCIDKDDDYGCSYTIKKYHSEKSINEDGTLENIKVKLVSLNPDYSPIELDKEREYKTIGIFKSVL